jgi:hypothetical protein
MSGTVEGESNAAAARPGSTMTPAYRAVDMRQQYSQRQGPNSPGTGASLRERWLTQLMQDATGDKIYDTA